MLNRFEKITSPTILDDIVDIKINVVRELISPS